MDAARLPSIGSGWCWMPGIWLRWSPPIHARKYPAWNTSSRCMLHLAAWRVADLHHRLHCGDLCGGSAHYSRQPEIPSPPWEWSVPGASFPGWWNRLSRILFMHCGYRMKVFLPAILLRVFHWWLTFGGMISPCMPIPRGCWGG